MDDVAEIERAIQLAIAPAFLLTGIFSSLNVLSGRLARLTDRERAIRSGRAQPLPGEHGRLLRRSRYVHAAFGCSVSAAILLCSLIVTSFGGVFFGLKVALVLAGLLIVAMLLLIAALTLFLMEIRLASSFLPSTDD